MERRRGLSDEQFHPRILKLKGRLHGDIFFYKTSIDPRPAVVPQVHSLSEPLPSSLTDNIKLSIS